MYDRSGSSTEEFDFFKVIRNFSLEKSRIFYPMWEAVQEKKLGIRPPHRPKSPLLILYYYIHFRLASPLNFSNFLTYFEGGARAKKTRFFDLENASLPKCRFGKREISKTTFLTCFFKKKIAGFTFFFV